jgi:hypothetical protein
MSLSTDFAIEDHNAASNLFALFNLVQKAYALHAQWQNNVAQLLNAVISQQEL